MSVIEVANLHKRYRDKVAVRDVSFSVAEGEIFGILGPNGAGKTTTVECVAGLRVPDSGRIRVLGKDPRRDAAQLHTQVGVQLQESHLPERLKVREALHLYASFYPDPDDWERLIDEWGMAEKRATPYGKLSGGQKQRLFIMLALVGRPRVVFLDELTTGLDPAARRETWGLIERLRQTGVTVVLVTHFMEEAERLCDRLAVIDDGAVVAIDSPGGLVSRMDSHQVIRFRVDRPFDQGLLTTIPEVSEVAQNGRHVVVTGRGDLLYAVTAVLARNHIVAADLRVEQANLDDAFVALTGKRF
ncbi:ABC transporter ATP-binding protein [Kibdelosporangium philippinense]|uniref:ABC transporter ATP-binding protein n=1 Tax=Kibdelosporangium philippinense TaxID=211113 RepID=A0ABS8ZJ82_9PSEU|nr:ABC transporter ATP-binding protein [Kibdelosporangium philippinense]MCE7006528.1 ABC transporter ATP-binding protein [Kibdelosporangium philippinense]